jgi:hypothetical protein
MILPVSLICLSVACRAVGELQQHKKLRWLDEADEFWGKRSDLRKYKFPIQKAPDNFYYRLFNVKYV